MVGCLGYRKKKGYIIAGEVHGFTGIPMSNSSNFPLNVEILLCQLYCVDLILESIVLIEI